jgi:phospholipase C
MANNLGSIKSIVVLMLENRSFDNILGWLFANDGQPLGGLTGKESNASLSGLLIPVSKNSTRDNVPSPDPGEEYQHINMQLFGSKTAPVPPTAKNLGFVLDYESVKGNPADIMACYDPSLIPNLAAIAKKYAVCDAWHAPVPSQTWPNRAFAHAATSWGMVNNFPYDPYEWRMPTIFQKMAAIPGMTWRVYYDDNYVSGTRLQFSPLHKPGYSKNIIGFENFLHDANAGQLPHYAFIEASFFHNPLTGKKQSDLHPPSHITPGDEFIARCYNAIVTSPQWAANEVLFVITFDEHGGCYDHVPPPANAVAPDNRKGQLGFNFKRFGVRVPAVVVSPFVVAGSLFHAAPQTMPYDHTSILATIEKVFNIAPLTKRDAAAQDLGSILTGPARTDSAPLTIAPQAFAAAAGAENEDLAAEPLNDLQRGMVMAMQKVVAQQTGVAASDVAVAAAAEEVRTVDDAHDFFRWAKRKTGL